MTPTRRAILAAPLALAACDRFASAEPSPPNVPPLKSIAPAPFGTAIKASQIDDPDWVALARGMGVQASRATTAEEFNRQFAAGLASPGPCLIEAVL